MNVTVNAAFETLVENHQWREGAQESLYVMRNNSEDVTSLQHHTEAWNNPNKIRIETVASSASTTAKVAAVIQSGGSFLSGSFQPHGRKIVLDVRRFASPDPSRTLS